MSSSYHIISQSLKSYYLMKLRSGQSQKRHKSRKNVGWFIQFEWRNLCWVVIFPPLCKSLTVRIFYSLRLVPFIESLALLREVGAGTTCCLLTRQHVSASTYRSCDNTLCYIQSSAMRGMYRSRYINCSLLKKHFLSKRPKQLNSETILLGDRRDSRISVRCARPAPSRILCSNPNWLAANKRAAAVIHVN